MEVLKEVGSLEHWGVTCDCDSMKNCLLRSDKGSPWQNLHSERCGPTLLVNSNVVRLIFQRRWLPCGNFKIEGMYTVVGVVGQLGATKNAFSNPNIDMCKTVCCMSNITCIKYIFDPKFILEY